MFQSPSAGAADAAQSSAATARYLQHNPPDKLQHMTEGMLGYSLFDTTRNQKWYYQIFNDCQRFKCDIEGWHTESGPGVYEAVSHLLMPFLGTANSRARAMYSEQGTRSEMPSAPQPV